MLFNLCPAPSALPAAVHFRQEVNRGFFDLGWRTHLDTLANAGDDRDVAGADTPNESTGFHRVNFLLR